MIKKHTALRIIAAVCIITITASVFSSCSDKYIESTSFVMGSILTSKIYTDDEELAKELTDKINTMAAAADSSLSATDENAELYALNRDGVIYASEYFYETLSDVIYICNILNKDIDITIGRVSSLWGFSSDTPSLPDEKDIEEALAYVGIEKILVDSDSFRITLDEGVMLDLGAFGKGIACDSIYETVRYKNVPVIVSMGGTIMAYGNGPKNDCWTVGIRNPFSDMGDSFATLSVDAASTQKNAVFISTSGSYEKSFTENGKTYHHILDTKTGYPVENDLVSVTVVASSGIYADALSTTVFIHGFNEEALLHLENGGAEAVFVFSDGSYYVTEGLRDSFTLKDKDFTEKEYEK